jgi:hypothetical protein
VTSSRLILHAIVLAITSLLGYRLGVIWGTYSASRFPSAMPVPFAVIANLILFAFWYHSVNALDSRRWVAVEFSSWLKISWYAMAMNIMLTCLFPGLVLAAPITIGRLVGLVCWSMSSIALTNSVVYAQRAWKSDLFLRRLLEFRLFRIALGSSAFFVAIALMVLLIEGLFFLVNLQGPSSPPKVYEGNYIGAGNLFDLDPDLGTRLLPEKDVSCRLKIGDQVIWDVHYGTDEVGRRKTVTNDAASHYAIFFGCSYLFGEGALDDETIPSEFSKAAPRFQGYNYGVPGFGTQQMLAKLEQGKLADEITQSNGIVFYLYLPETHESRVIGEFQVFNSFASGFPYYSLDRDGSLVRMGSFESGRRITSACYSLLGKSQTVRYFGLNFPKRSESHYQTTAKIIERSRDLCHEQLHCDEFYVVVYPRRIDVQILPYLDDLGIRYLDYSRLFNPLEAGMSHPIDEHPSPKANRKLAQKLAADTCVEAGE